VGTAALQICRKFGATAIGTASSAKHARLREMGLAHAIDYRSEDFEREVKRITSGRGVDVALDAVGSFRKSFRCLAPVGRLMMYGASATVSGETRNVFAAFNAVLQMRWFHPLQLLPDNKGIFGVNMGQLWGEMELLGREMKEILRGFEAGEFKAIVDQEVPFAEARRAHERLQSRANFGKVVLVP
jgi:NADPH:quinone reductase-like Zn-dependent oxidoreductase